MFTKILSATSSVLRLMRLRTLKPGLPPLPPSSLRTGEILLAGLVLAVATAPAAAADPPQWECVTVLGTGQKQLSPPGKSGRETNVGQPFGVLRTADGRLLVCEVENHRVLSLNLKSGQVTVVAGSGKKGYAGDGGPATEASCNEPYEVRLDPAGNVVFVEMQNHLVRKVDRQTGLISTIAGTGQAGYDASEDGGPALKARLKQPHSIAFDRKDDLYIADIGNHRVRVMEFHSNTLTTAAGTGVKGPLPHDVKIAGTPLFGPRAIDFDREGRMLLALREGNAILRLDFEADRITHLAGTGKAGYSGDGGPARLAQLAGPKGISLAPNGDIYFADTESHTIRVVREQTGIVETVVGDGKPGDGPDGDPKRCRLDRPHGVFVDREGTVYIGDSNNHKVRQLRPVR